jgi:lysine-N-methylase
MSKLYYLEMLVPKYVSDFRCIGSQCPDSCCERFAVNIDKDTFRAYRRSEDPILKPLFKLNLLRSDKNSTDALYGKFKTNPPANKCTFLDAECGCLIQKRLGEDGLSDVCFSYPRHTFQINDHLEQTLGLSCPEAARLALTMQDGFEFIQQTRPVRGEYGLIKLPLDGVSIQDMDEVRIFSVQIVQSTDLSLLQKWVALGWVCLRVDETLAKQLAMQDILIELQQLLEQGAISELASQQPLRLDLQAKVFAHLFSARGLRQHDLPWREEVFSAISRGLGGNENGLVDEKTLIARYEYGVEVLSRGMIAFEQILQRYLINEMLQNLFPWADGGAMVQFRKTLSRFGLIRFMIVATAADRGELLSESDMIRIVQVFCRTYLHDPNFSGMVDDALAASAWSELTNLYYLVRHV